MPTESTLKSKLESVKAEFNQSIEKLRADAAASAKDLEQRYKQYAKAREEIAAKVVQPRLEELAAQIPGMQHELQRDIDGGRLILRFPRTPERAALIEVDLSIAHDDAFKKILFTYELRIIPVFMEFDKFSQFSQPLDNLQLPAVADWLDERLLAFMKTYLNMQFVEQYGKDNMATDPVLSRRFPRNLAAGDVEHKGVRYYFVTNESMAMFKANPDSFLGRSGG
mgnify:CR=1 FL=1